MYNKNPTFYNPQKEAKVKKGPHGYQQLHTRVDTSEDERIREEQMFTVFSNASPGSAVTHIYISKPIGSPESYVELIYNMHIADEDDVFVLHLNCPGGRVDTGIQLLNAIRNTQATVITVLESEVASMATLLFLAGDQQVVLQDSSLMFHDFKTVMIGSGTNMKYQLDATIDRVRRMAHGICYPFFSHAEIDDILSGKDVWINSDEIHARFEAAAERVAQDKAAEKKKADAEARKKQQAEAAAKKTPAKRATKRATTPAPKVEPQEN